MIRMKKLIPSSWKTKNLVISDAQKEDVESLQAIYEAGFKKKWIYSEKKPLKKYIYHRLNNPMLPPNGNAELERLQAIFSKETGSIIGYLSFYHGFPIKNAFWINDLFLHPSSQNKGYGKEIVSGLQKQVRKLNRFKSMNCKVRLKNWSAIKFWISVGFNRVTAYEGDIQLKTNSSADISLEKEL